jgi:hypothetical protein
VTVAVTVRQLPVETARNVHPGAMTLFAAAVVAAAGAVAAVLRRGSADGVVGRVAGPVVLLLCVALWVLPAPWSVLATPGDAGWPAARNRMLGMIALAAAAFVLAARESHRPASRRTAARHRRPLLDRRGERNPIVEEKEPWTNQRQLRPPPPCSNYDAGASTHSPIPGLGGCGWPPSAVQPLSG